MILKQLRYTFYDRDKRIDQNENYHKKRILLYLKFFSFDIVFLNLIIHLLHPLLIFENV
jgi:hypothetical protein